MTSFRRLILVGDSIPQGEAENVSFGLGGHGSWPQLLMAYLANILGLGPLVSPGLIPAITGRSDWTFSGQDGSGNTDWSDIAPTDVFDRAPGFATGATKKSHFASGSSHTAQLAITRNCIRPVVEHTWVLIDSSSGGTASPSISIDGASYANLSGYTPANDNKIVLCHVPTPVRNTTTIRCANAAGTAQSTALIGAIPWYYPPATATGICGHIVANGGTTLDELVKATSGDRMAMFDPAQIRLVNGAVSWLDNLDAILIDFLNDAALVSAGDATVWGTDLTTAAGKIQPRGPLGVISDYEANTAFWSSANQAAMRAMTKTKAAALGFSSLDLNDEMVSLGFANNAALHNAGFLDSIDTHPEAAFCKLLASRIGPWARAHFFPSYTGPSTYTANAKRAAVAYAAKQAPRAAKAGVPVGVVVP